MSLEDVKVGDPLWHDWMLLGNKRRDLVKVTHLTKTRIYVGENAWRRVATKWWHKVGNPYGSASGTVSVATPAEIAAWEVSQAEQQAATEAAERERERVTEDRQDRLKALWDLLSITGVGLVSDDHITFNHGGHRYEIREVAAHREE